MTALGWIQILLYCAIIVAITPVLGAYMTRVFGGERTFLSPVLRPVELAIYKIAGVDERQEQHAVTYTVGMLLFHLGGLFIIYVRLPCESPPHVDQSGISSHLADARARRKA
jgi:potassium-transporting ATPase potassium-binding subunit